MRSCGLIRIKVEQVESLRVPAVIRIRLRTGRAGLREPLEPVEPVETLDPVETHDLQAGEEAAGTERSEGLGKGRAVSAPAGSDGTLILLIQMIPLIQLRQLDQLIQLPVGS